MIKKENICWAEDGARTRQSLVSGRRIPTHIQCRHTWTRSQPFIHACMLRNGLPPNLQTSKKKKKFKQKKKKKFPTPFPLHMHNLARNILCASTPAQQGASRAKKKRRRQRKEKQLGFGWRNHCSNETNLHTRRLRSEYAWENKTLCLEADHPLSLDYCAHLRAFYLFFGKRSSWFSAHLLMALHNNLGDVNLLKRERQIKKKSDLWPRNFSNICKQVFLEGLFAHILI